MIIIQAFCIGVSVKNEFTVFICSRLLILDLKESVARRKLGISFFTQTDSKSVSGSYVRLFFCRHIWAFHQPGGTSPRHSRSVFVLVTTPFSPIYPLKPSSNCSTHCRNPIPTSKYFPSKALSEDTLFFLPSPAICGRITKATKS